MGDQSLAICILPPTYTIARMSLVSWQHLNLQGKFDFSDEALADALHFDLGTLLTVE